MAGYEICPRSDYRHFALVHGGMERVVRQGKGTDDEEQAEEDIMASLALGELQGQIAEHERDMIESILDMADLTVEEVMTPRTKCMLFP